MRSKQGIFLWPLLFGLLLWGEAGAAGLEAKVDRNRIPEGETLNLTLRAAGDVQGSPDLTPLSQDFDLLSQGQSSRMSISNGRTESSREWHLTLAPKHAGRLILPALSLGSLTSAPIEMEVLPAGQATAPGQTPPAFVEVEVDSESPYVQGEVIYTVRIFHRVPLHQAQLSEPGTGDALLERLGEERNYRADRGGHTYQVVEQRYALFPQRSGELVIDAPVLSARVAETGARRSSPFGADPFGGMAPLFGPDPFDEMEQLLVQSRPIRLKGRPITLKVRPQPAGAQSPWLPAESLTLAEEWSSHPLEFRVGEPVTRTIAITAQGVASDHLPDLNPPLPEGINAYPDKPRAETRADGDALVTQKVVKIALVPTQPGEITLPGVRLPWWDIQSDQQQVAELPSRTIKVLPARAGMAAPPPAPQPASQKVLEPQPAPSVPAADLGADKAPLATNPAEPVTSNNALPWPWIAAALGLGWLASLVLWSWRALTRNERVKPLIRDTVRPVRASQCLPEVRRSFQANAPRAARKALLTWAEARWPEAPPRTLEGVGLYLGGEAIGLMRALDGQLYSGKSAGWDGVAAWERLAPLLGQGEGKADRMADATALPELYPRP